MIRLIFATKNKHKMQEIREIFSGLPFEIVSMEEIGVDVEVVEDGTTFAENSFIKAKEISKYFPNDIVMADDSGLEIDYLNKEPGVYSARYLGKDTPYIEKNTIILDRLKDVKGSERSARFVCNITAFFPDGTHLQTEGVMEGEIAKEIAGENGFGYDPIFYVPEFGMTSALMSREEKNSISHRGKALRMMEKLLRDRVWCERQSNENIGN